MDTSPRRKEMVMRTERIVVGVDGSSGSDAALEWAINAAGSAGAEIIAVQVVESIGGPAPVTAPLAIPPRHPASSNGRAIVAEACNERLRTSGVAYRLIAVQGHPATEILRAADDEHADLIVVGNGLHSTMTDIFLGSVAHELTHHARRPLVIVPARQPAPDVDALGRKYPAGRTVALVTG
jgi:nucleotide-binding universal stress UspA family protein